MNNIKFYKCLFGIFLERCTFHIKLNMFHANIESRRAVASDLRDINLFGRG